MGFPWPVVIALAVLAFAFAIKHLFTTIIEEENVFLCIVGAFIVIYVGAALAVGWLMPKIPMSPDVPLVTE